MLVMQVTKHSPENCPAYNPKYRAATVNWYEKVEPTAAKYGIKFMGSWDDHMAHKVFALYDTPSMDILMKFMMEPEMMAPMEFCRGRIFPVFDHKTTLAMINK
ncbi:MAG: hypothetical protein A4E32_01531 [Methanomassiliicoccales archaeon PtaU1.Bin124]|nr:MAG: hypothetical protein A4E32_01531 [Methanomassiliicoccales archaeon PtaU1.Bin124]